MNDFNSILNWRLLSGSHDFPGPEGGTCINEAAIVAAFQYGLGYSPCVFLPKQVISQHAQA